MKLIVGLGNIGKEYDNTRHNVGFMVLDTMNLDFKLEKKFQAYLCRKKINSEDVIFIKPTTYMNLSGNSVIKVVNYYKIKPDDILVVHDDLDLPFNHFKCKFDSSSGGHNGIKSIIASLNTQKFARLKIGIAHDKSVDTKDYVLGTFSKKELSVFFDKCELYREIILNFICNGINDTMGKFNGRM